MKGESTVLAKQQKQYIGRKTDVQIDLQTGKMQKEQRKDEGMDKRLTEGKIDRQADRLINWQIDGKLKKSSKQNKS